MSLSTFQQSLARLLTDEAAREAFVYEPQNTGANWQLSPEEIESLQVMAACDIPEFARALHAKRRAEAADLLPRTRHCLGAQFKDLFAQHAAHFVPSGAQKPRADAIAFACWLQNQNIEKTARETARYEAFLLHGADGKCRIGYFALQGQKLFVCCARSKIFVWPRGKAQTV